jgi:hypothetical protein
MGVYKRPDTGRWEIRLQIRGVKYHRSVPEASEQAAGEGCRSSPAPGNLRGTLRQARQRDRLHGFRRVLPEDLPAGPEGTSQKVAERGVQG